MAEATHIADALTRLGQECQPEGFPDDAPAEALFDTKKVAIVSNGRHVRLLSPLRYSNLIQSNYQMR